MTDAYARTLVVLTSIVAVIAAGAALRATYLVTMPLAFAFFVSVLVWPIHAGLRRRLPARLGWLSIVVAMLVILAALALFLGGTWAVVHGVASDRGQEYVQQAQERWQALGDWLRERGLPAPTEDRGGELLAGIVDWAQSAVASVTGLAAALVLIVFFSLMMLVEAHHWRDKSRTALPRAGAHSVIDAVGAITVRMAISPLVVLLSVVFWAWVWGPAGAIIAVPMTATIMIACAHVPALQPIALLMSRTADKKTFAAQTHAG